MHCQKLYQPGQMVSVDERMIRMKGRSILRQYLPNKPTKWGIKLFAACDVATSYMFNLEVYTGAAPDEPQDVGSTHAVVRNMMEPYQHQNYVVLTDNFYTSPALSDSLQSWYRVSRHSPCQPCWRVEGHEKNTKAFD